MKRGKRVLVELINDWPNVSGMGDYFGGTDADMIAGTTPDAWVKDAWARIEAEIDAVLRDKEGAE